MILSNDTIKDTDLFKSTFIEVRKIFYFSSNKKSNTLF